MIQRIETEAVEGSALSSSWVCLPDRFVEGLVTRTSFSVCEMSLGTYGMCDQIPDRLASSPSFTQFVELGITELRHGV